jgi:hypothetical protein
MLENLLTADWTSVPGYIRSRKCPIDLRWLIFHRKEEMLKVGCLLKIGKRLLVDHSRLMLFLERLSERGESIVPKEVT